MAAKRISYIDMAKGIGILLVVLGHSGFASESLLTWIMSFHMPLFFILSGMLLSHTNASSQNMSTFLKKKVRTVLIPYFAFSVLSILFSGILDFASFGSYLPNALVQTITFYGISVLWFLPALFFGETIFLFIRKHTSLIVSGLLYLTICLITVFSANTYHYHYVTNFENYISVLGAYLIAVFVRTGMAVTFLAIGYYTYHFFFQYEKKKLTYGACAAIFLALNVVLALKNGKVDLNYLIFHNYFLYFAAAFCGSMFVICLSAALPTWKPLIATGKHSLIIMSTHMNCRFLGVCYALGNVAISLLPFLGNLGYMLVCMITMTILEIIAIYLINRFCPFIIGASKKVYSS